MSIRIMLIHLLILGPKHNLYPNLEKWPNSEQILEKEPMMISFIVTLNTSKEIIKEIRHSLEYPHITKKYHFKKEDVESLIDLIEHEAVVASDSIRLNLIKEDPSDNKILACAIEAQANYIVSGDKHLLKLQQYKNILIVTTQKFLEIIKANSR